MVLGLEIVYGIGALGFMLMYLGSKGFVLKLIGKYGFVLLLFIAIFQANISVIPPYNVITSNVPLYCTNTIAQVCPTTTQVTSYALVDSTTPLSVGLAFVLLIPILFMLLLIDTFFIIVVVLPMRREKKQSWKSIMFGGE